MNIDSTFHKSPRNALKYYYITNSISFIILLAILSTLYYCWYTFKWWDCIPYILIALTIIAFIHCCLAPLVRYKFHYYKLKGNFIILKQTFFFKKEELSKIEKLQYVIIGTNPLAKLLRLKSVEFVTAGHEMALPMVSEKEGEMLQKLALERLRGVTEDV